ncbi:MAG: hypothetical protein JSR17_11975 [Proteobacteria bacterium]|nr:hypothetical protein [Pseudomonadota bacterium]
MPGIYIKNKLIKMAYNAIFGLDVEDKESKEADLKNLVLLDKITVLESFKEQVLIDALQLIHESTDSIYPQREFSKLFYAILVAKSEHKKKIIQESITKKPTKGILIAPPKEHKPSTQKQVRFIDKEDDEVTYFVSTSPTASAKDYRKSDKDDYKTKRTAGILDLYFNNPPSSIDLETDDFKVIKQYFKQHKKENCMFTKSKDKRNVFIVTYNNTASKERNFKKREYSKKELREIIFGFQLQKILSVAIGQPLVFTYYGQESYASFTLDHDTAQMKALITAMNLMGFYAEQNETDNGLDFDCEQLREAFNKDTDIINKLVSVFKECLEKEQKPEPEIRMELRRSTLKIQA